MQRKITSAAWPLFCLAIAVCALLAVGCSSKSTSDETPENSSVTVTASPSSINSGETSVIEVSVVDGATGVADQEVTFSVTPSSAGYFTPATDTTDANGVAASIFTATTSSGSVTVTASVNGGAMTKNVGVTVQSIQDGGDGGVGSVTINANRTLLLANGSDTSQLSITVRDDLAQPAADSTVVKLAAGEKFADIDGNGYWSEGIDSIIYDANANGQWDAYGLIPSTTVVSGGSGVATANYVSGFDAMTVYIKATVDHNGITASADLSLQLNPDATIASIYLSSDSMQLAVKQTGGIETGILRARAYDISGNAVPEGMQINFIIVDGPGGGEHLSNVGTGPYTATTNSQGVASVALHSGTISGTVRIRAYADTVLSNATQVLISAGPPAYIVVGAEECNVDFWDNVAGENNIVAVVSDIYLNPVNDSTVVYFSTDEGTMKSHEKRTQDHEGIATTKWFSGNNVPTADGIVWIYAETAGGTVADSSAFVNSHIPSTMYTSGWQTSLLADGESSFWTWVHARDLNNNFVISGTTFKGEANYLAVSGAAFEDGCNSSAGRVQVTSKTLKQDFSLTGGNDDGVGAIDYVTYWHAGGSAVTEVCSLLTGTAYSGNSTIDMPTSASIGDNIPITVIVQDRYGNPLGDHTITVTASGGTITGGTQETNAFGEAGGITWVPSGIGDITITATDNDPRGGIVLTNTVTVE